MAEKLLEVKHLKKYFDTPRGKLHAVDDVSFSIEKGKTLGVVGESGCGKSTTGRCILRLIEPTSGEVIFNGQDITKLHPRDMKALRKDMQIIFQDPYASLDPRKTISQIISEPIIINKILTNKQDVEDRVHELMDTVGLAQRLVNTYPHELDGGRRQRIGIARALAMNPKFIVCDEPVSALDVSIQAQILNLLQDLQEKMELTFMLSTTSRTISPSCTLASSWRRRRRKSSLPIPCTRTPRRCSRQSRFRIPTTSPSVLLSRAKLPARSIFRTRATLLRAASTARKTAIMAILRSWKCARITSWPDPAWRKSTRSERACSGTCPPRTTAEMGVHLIHAAF